MSWPEKCPRCGKAMTAHGFAASEGFICTRCIGKQRKLKRRKKKQRELQKTSLR